MATTLDEAALKHRESQPAPPVESSNVPVATEEGPHEHVSTPRDKRLWLEALPDQAATMRLHPYCVECGAVRSLVPAKGRPLGTFLKAISNLKEVLEDNPRYPKLAQVHSHLISKALESIPSFGDPYSMPFETQWTVFVSSVRRYRPDLDEEFLEMIMPREPRRARPSYIELLTSPGKGGTESEVDP